MNVDSAVEKIVRYVIPFMIGVFVTYTWGGINLKSIIIMVCLSFLYGLFVGYLDTKGYFDERS